MRRTDGAGAAHVFTRSGMAWSQHAELPGAYRSPRRRAWIKA
jgi:hypothetical protein